MEAHAIGPDPPCTRVGRVVIRVDPDLRYLVETRPASVGRFRGQAYLRLGRPPSPPGGSPRS